MARETTESTDRDRGRKDGFDGYEARDGSPEYLDGYAEGQRLREEAHARLDETCRRFKRYALED